MNLEEKEITIYRYNGQYGTSYSIKIAKKNIKGEFETAFMPVKFKKGVEIANKTKIIIKNGWITFNLVDKKPNWYVFINEFDEVDYKVDHYQEFAEETKSDEFYMELPF